MTLIPPEVLLNQIKREAADRKTGDEGLLGKISSLSDDIAATIVSIKSQTKTVREIRDEFTATVGDATARILSLETVGISDRAAFIEQFHSITVSVADAANLALAAQASIDEYKTVAAANGVAVADQVVRLQSKVGDNFAAITEEKITRATQDDVLASLITSVSVAYIAADAILAASITSESTARASADSAEATTRASTDASLTTAIGVVSAAVTTETSARVAADGTIFAQWGVAININGSVVGRIHLDGTGTTSEFSVEATKFTVWNGTSNVPPFQVVGGVVRVSSLVIASTDVSGLATVATTGNFDDVGGAHKPANNADVTLTAINGGLIITSGGITLNGSPSIKSNNFVAGVSGWQIDGAGNAEFQSATIRGSLNAGDLVAGTVPQPRLPAGVIPNVSGTVSAGSNLNLSVTNPQVSGLRVLSLPIISPLTNVTFVGRFTNNTGTPSSFSVMLYIDGSVVRSFSTPNLASGSGCDVFILYTAAISNTTHDFEIWLAGFPGNHADITGTLTVQ